MMEYICTSPCTQNLEYKNISADDGVNICTSPCTHNLEYKNISADARENMYLSVYTLSRKQGYINWCWSTHVGNTYSITITRTSRSGYSSVSLSDQCLNPDTISIAININRKLVTINAKSKDTILLAIGVNMDTTNQMMNVSNRTWSTRQQSRELLLPLPLGGILFAMSTRTIEIYWSMSQTGHYPHN